MHKIYKWKCNDHYNYIVMMDEYNRWAFSTKRYGKYAEKVAQLSASLGMRVNNYFEVFGEYTILYAYSKQYGYKKIYIDTEDLSKVQQHSWIIFKGERSNTYYAHARAIKSNGKQTTLSLHRFITNCPDDKIVDHIDRNGLNNMKCNLRKETHIINNRNKQKTKLNTTGFPGVMLRGNRYIAFWMDENGRHSKSYNINKYGKEEAFNKAVYKRYREGVKNGYIFSKEEMNLIKCYKATISR